MFPPAVIFPPPEYHDEPDQSPELEVLKCSGCDQMLWRHELRDDGTCPWCVNPHTHRIYSLTTGKPVRRTEEVSPKDLQPGDRVATSCGIITVKEIVPVVRNPTFPLTFDVRIVPVENQPSVTVHSSNTVTKLEASQ